MPATASRVCSSTRTAISRRLHALPAASATTFSAASFIVRAAYTLGSAASCRSSRPSTSLVPSRRTTNGTVGSISSNAAIRPLATSSQRVMPPKMLNSTALTASLARISSHRLLDLLRVRAAAGVEEVRRRAARLGDHVERRHDQAGAVAEDADVAVELDVLDALLLGAALDRVFVLGVRELLVLGVAVERVPVQRDLRVERLHLPLGRDDQRVDLGERRVLLRATPRTAPPARRRRRRSRPRRRRRRWRSPRPPRARARRARRRGGGSASPGVFSATSSMSTPPSTLNITSGCLAERSSSTEA